jgi:outer membrane protein assembly factor BamA
MTRILSQKVSDRTLVSTKGDTCTRTHHGRAHYGYRYVGIARNFRVKLLRVCLTLWALCPLASGAADAGRDTNPIVEGVQCTGNVTTSCALIRSQAGIVVGKELDDIQVENARLRLEGLTRFRSAKIHLVKGSQKHRVILIIDVVESSPFATAFAAGAVLQFPLHTSAETGVVAGRITDYDLFGSGKSLDFAVVGARALNGGGNGGSSEYAVRLEYRDPRLCGSRTFFLTAGAFYTQAVFGGVEYLASPSSTSVDQLPGPNSGRGQGLDFSLGAHFGSYSYVTAGYRYMPNSSSGGSFLVSDGIFTTLNRAGGNVALFTIGRNAEDDPSFPTHGWLLHAYDGWNPTTGGDFGGVLIRGTWRAGQSSYWTFQTRPFDNFRSLFDDDLGVSIVYARDFSVKAEAESRRARWYIGPGVTNLGHIYGVHYYEVGAKAGVRLETKYFGTVNFYLIATYPVHAGN